MLRRNVNLATTPTSSSDGTHLQRPPRHGGSTKQPHRPSEARCNAWFLLTAAVLITAATFLLTPSADPNSKDSSVYTGEVVHDLYAAEQRIVAWAHGGGGDAAMHPTGSWAETSEQATARMLAQDSTWVDGEKKLKIKLKVLAERQAQGKDIGVPVLTRYLGEDIPAWPGEGVNREEWQAKVDARYQEMRQEEEVWKAKMTELLKQHAHG